mmetsp:Transcript_8380/g.18393  ORF Transcript_8380/g.18393 Transcript_8380/m.18393 type:complete len:217 (+) Transcript_8380:1119-1769(+)
MPCPSPPSPAPRDPRLFPSRDCLRGMRGWGGVGRALSGPSASSTSTETPSCPVGDGDGCTCTAAAEVRAVELALPLALALVPTRSASVSLALVPSCCSLSMRSSSWAPLSSPCNACICSCAAVSSRCCSRLSASSTSLSLSSAACALSASISLFNASLLCCSLPTSLAAARSTRSSCRALRLLQRLCRTTSARRNRSHLRRQVAPCMTLCSRTACT